MGLTTTACREKGFFKRQVLVMEANPYERQKEMGLDLTALKEDTFWFVLVARNPFVCYGYY